MPKSVSDSTLNHHHVPDTINGTVRKELVTQVYSF